MPYAPINHDNMLLSVPVPAIITKGCICYIEGAANKDILAELERRLDKFSIDGTY